jgi:hypothetical protein
VADLGTSRQLWIPTETESGEEHRVVTVKLPPGVKDGTLLRLPGQGEPSPTGGPPGDLYVRVRVKPYVPGVAPDAWAATAPPGPAGPPAANWPGAPGTATPPPRRRSSRRRTVLLVVLAAVGTVVAATTFIRTSGGDGAPAATAPALASASGASTTTPSAPTPTTPTGMSPASYQKALSAFDARLAKQFETLRKARKPSAVRKTMSGIQATLSDAKADLGLLDPPVAVEPAHTALLDAMETLATDLAGAESEAADGQVCAGSSATALISRTDGARQVRAAAAKVAVADRAHKYQVGRFVPRSRGDRSRRLGNGTVIRRPAGGLGQLKIDNRGGDDLVMSLVRQGAHTPVLAVFVRGGGKATVSGIRDGRYRVFMTAGRDWDSALRVFTRDCTFERFDDPAPYTTTAGTYTVLTYTLRLAGGGNASTSPVGSDSFPSN